MVDPQDETKEGLPFRSMMTFGTDEGAPRGELVTQFLEHELELVTHVPLQLQAAFFKLPHDMSNGSDGLLVVEGLITQAAAELWAIERILKGRMALLTMFHHVRTLYEAHALTYWLLQDFVGRWPRVLKERQVERDRFEAAAAKSIGPVASDISDAGRALVADSAIKRLPSVFDMIEGNAVLEFDHAVFWKYSSAHTHPGFTFTAQIDAENERETIQQILGAAIRHTAGVYRLIADHFGIAEQGVIEPLAAAEDFARYRFSLHVSNDGAPETGGITSRWS